MLLHNSVTEDPTIWAGLNHPELSLEDVDIAVFGIPYDGGVSFRSGTCEAPQELRKITHTISPTTEDFRDISPLKVKDLGDCMGKDRDEMFAEAEELAFRAVKAGKNRLEVRVTNLWPNRLIGDEQPDVTKRITYVQMPFYQVNAPLLPSGLLGPVSIVGERYL